MSRFPQELDDSRTSHFLFELGSVMTTLFVILSLVSMIVVGIGVLLGQISQLGVFVAGISGLLSLFGLGTLYVSLSVDQ